MQSLKQSLGKGRAACSSKAGRKGAFTINALRSSVSCGQHQTPVSATATARRLGQACLRASQSRKNVCVVKSVLAESTANAVDGCPRGSHWQVIMVRGNQQSVATRLSSGHLTQQQSTLPHCMHLMIVAQPVYVTLRAAVHVAATVLLLLPSPAQLQLRPAFVDASFLAARETFYLPLLLLLL
jgi:hypothetical protein